MDKLAADVTTLMIAVTGLLVVVGALIPAARRLAVKVFVGYVAIPALLGTVLIYMASSVSKALAGTPMPSWFVLVPVLLLAPIVSFVLGLKIITGIVRVLFGERAAGHVGGVIALRVIDRIFGRRRGRPIPAADHTADDQPQP